MLRAAILPLHAHGGSIDAKSDDDFWAAYKNKVVGGVRILGSALRDRRAPTRAAVPAASAKNVLATPEFAGAVADFPFYFQPFVSQSLGDGSLANLPWMQELPDVLSTAMWSTWVEINTKTGARLGIQQGDLIEIASSVGKLRAARFFPRELPRIYWRCQSDRDTRILAGMRAAAARTPSRFSRALTERETGSLAWAATRVKLTRVGGPEQAKLVFFSGGMSGFPHEEEPR